MVDILDETLQDLQEEKQKKILKKWGKPVLVLIALFLLVVLGRVWWNVRNAEVSQEEGAKFMSIVSNMKNKQLAEKKLTDLSRGKSIYATFAGLNLSLMEAYGGNFELASQTYEEISKNDKLDATFRNYAELMSLSMALAAQSITDEEALEKLDSYIKRKPAFKYSALEIKAALLMEQNNIAEARKILEGIVKDRDAPEAIKPRVYQELLVAAPNNKK